MEKDKHVTNRSFLLMQSFWRLQKSIMIQVKQTANDNDLSVPQFSILMMMQHKKQMAQKVLQAETYYPKSTLSYAIDGLVQAGFLKRTHVEDDRREINLTMSKQGQTFLNQMKQRENSVHMIFKNAVNSLTEEQFNELLNMHQHISMYFEGGGTN